MTPLRRQILLGLFMSFDMIVMAAAFGLAAIIVQTDLSYQRFAEYLSIRTEVSNFAIMVLLISVWHYTLFFFDLYQSRRLRIYRSEEIISVISATTTGTAAIWIIGLALDVETFTPRFVLVFWAIVTATIIGSRLAVRYLLTRLRLLGRNLRYLVIVGTNARAIEFAQMITSRPEFGYRISGFVDREWYGTELCKKAGFNVSSDFDHFKQFIRENVIDEVVLFVPIKTFYQQSVDLIALCAEQGITVRFASEVIMSPTGRTRVEHIEGYPLATISTGSIRDRQLLAKYLFDFTAALIALILLSPLCVLIAVAIKLSSPGPVFFIQDRVGLNKRRFRLYKFRTMVPGAEAHQKELEAQNEAYGPVFKIKADPRVTAIGKFLRKTSLDELPQLINVLKGEMSLVGPRPLPVRDYQGFNEDWHRRRFSVRPGLTCLWQINGRHSVTFEEWMEMDMKYIDSWSLWLDLKILAKTIPAVFRGAGAY